MLGCLLIISCRFMQLKLTLLNLQVCNRHASCRVLITKVWLLTCFFNSLNLISHFFLTSFTICNIHFEYLNDRTVKSIRPQVNHCYLFNQSFLNSLKINSIKCISIFHKDITLEQIEFLSQNVSVLIYFQATIYEA